MAYAGQRTALNLVNIKTDAINRGEVLAAQDSLLKRQFIDAKVPQMCIRDSSKRFAAEFAQELRNDGVDAVILTSTSVSYTHLPPGGNLKRLHGLGGSPLRG